MRDYLILFVSALALLLIIPPIYRNWKKDKEANGYDPDNEW